MEDTLKRVREQKAVYEVADKEIEMDDFVSFEYSDSEIEGGEDIPSTKETIKKMGNEIFPPDLMEKVIGKKKGDIVEFSTTFDEMKSKELAGKTVKIKVAISEVKRKTLPSMDDEFAKDLGFETVAELKEKLKEKIQTAKTEQAKKIQKAQIVNKLIESYSFEVPDVLLQREMDGLMMQQSTDAKEEAKPDDSSSENTEGTGALDQKIDEDPGEKLRRRALRNVQAALIIDAIGRKESVVVSDREVDERVSMMAQRLSTTPENIRSFYEYRGGLENLKQSIFEEKVLDILLSKAVIEKEHKGE
jgi:trigger factor